MDNQNNQNIIHDRFDHMKFNKTVIQSDLNKNITNGVSEYPQFGEFIQDAFYSLFRYVPKFEDMGDVNPNFYTNRQMLESMQGMQQYGELRAYTKLNPVNSGIGAATLGELVLKENQEQFKQMKQQQQQMQQNQQKLQQLKQELKNAKQNTQQAQTPQQQAQAQNHMNQLAGKASQLLEQQKQLQQQQQQTASQINLHSALAQTSESLSNQSEIFNLGRGGGAGTEQRVNIQERLAFSKAFVSNKNFQKLMKMLGRMKRLAEKKQREKTKHAADTIDSIKQSDDLAHLVASEALNLADSDLEILFDKKFVEKELLTYDLAGQIEKGKGPIVSCLDVSGSMSGDPDVISKSVALALVHIAHMQKRDAVVILFDHGVRYTVDFPISDSNYWEKLQDMASYFSGGGTNFTFPLQKSMTYFTSEKKFSKADLVFITDGNGSLSTKVKVEFLDLKKEQHINVFSIIIGGFDWVDHELRDISNSLVNVSDLNDQIAGDLFESI